MAYTVSEADKAALEIDSKELEEVLDGLESLNSPDVALGLIEYMRNGIEEL